MFEYVDYQKQRKQREGKKYCKESQQVSQKLFKGMKKRLGK